MKLRFIVVICGVLLLGSLLFSCEEDIDFNPALVTEDVIFASGERLRISGRIITNQRINAIDHGFLVAENPSFGQSQSISLGERQDPGRFIGEIDGLNIGTKYYVQAFADLDGEMLLGNVLEIETLIPEAFQLSPNNGPAGSIVTISGKNFTSGTEVFFGAQKADVVNIDFESIMQVRVPEIGDEPVVNIRILTQDQELTLGQNFTYQIGIYTKISDLPSPVRVFDGVSLQEGSTFYFGKGSDRGQGLNSSMWRYQIGQNNWQVTDFPLENLWRAFSSQNYVGGGFRTIIAPQPNSEIYRLENGNFNKLPDLPFNVSDGMAFELGGRFYVAGGSLGTMVYKFTPGSNSWEMIGNAPFSLDYTLLNFSYGNRHYVINPDDSQLHAFNSQTETWELIASYPGSLGNGRGIAVAIGNKAYIGAGNRSNQMWEFDLIQRTWLRKNDFSGSPNARTEAVFLWDEKIYFIRSAEVQVLGVPSEFWLFEPDGF